MEVGDLTSSLLESQVFESKKPMLLQLKRIADHFTLVVSKMYTVHVTNADCSVIRPLFATTVLLHCPDTGANCIKRTMSPTLLTQIDVNTLKLNIKSKL